MTNKKQKRHTAYPDPEVGTVFIDANGHEREITGINGCGYLETKFLKPQGSTYMYIGEYKKLQAQ